jgi:hypothetical protein
VRWLAHFATCSVYRCLSGSVRATAGSAIIASYHRQYLPHQPNRHGRQAGRQAGAPMVRSERAHCHPATATAQISAFLVDW